MNRRSLNLWTVLLVEDELFVRESIKEIIPWEQHNYRLIGEASNGIEAMTFIETHEPDVVITDIIMPEMDGLELLKTARSRGYSCKFVMLTCMNEFHYVRESLEYGASNYILKLSMSVKSLSETLGKINVELNKGKEYQEYETTQFYRTWWEAIFDKKRDAMGTTHRLEVPIRNGSAYYCRIIGIFHGRSSYGENEFLAHGLLAHPDRCVIHLFTLHGVTSVFVWSPDPIQVYTTKLENSSELVISENFTLKDIIESWKSVIRKLTGYWYEIVDENILPTCGQPWYWEEETYFFQQFEQMKIEECKQMIDRLWISMKESRLCMIAAKQLVVETDRTLQRLSRTQYEETNEGWASSDALQLKQWFTARMEEYIQVRCGMLEGQTDHEEVNKVKNYILQNYGESVTVKSMAKLVALDETYLSNLFKQKTGETLIKFLHRIRMDKSIYYLERTNLSIADIGIKTGFNNINYLNRLFKRTVGITPSEYRTKYRNAHDEV
jgi:two-component system response regulator YesN